MSASSNLTIKEEKFCQKLLELGVQTAAYRAAYDAGNMAPNTIKVAACQLSKKPRVAARIKELEVQAAAEARVTRSFILQGLMTEAKDAKEGSARVRALELLGKATEGGIFTDRTLDKSPDESAAEIKRDLFGIQAEIISLANADELEAMKAEIKELARLVKEQEGKIVVRGKVVPIQEGKRRI